MAIKPISRTEFDRFQPMRADEAEEIFEEVEWFSDDHGTIIGVLVRHRSDRDWAYAVLGPDERGTFRAFENEVSFLDAADARLELLGLMEHVLSAGLRVFPQGD